MDATNYYEYMKRFDALRKQKEELIHRREQEKLKARVELLRDLKDSLLRNVAEIKRSSDHINANADRLSLVLARKSTESVRMDKSCVHNVRNIVESVGEIFESASETSDGDMRAFDLSMLEFAKTASKLRDAARKVHNNCYTLFNNVRYLKSGETENDNSLNPTNDVVLSDSSFLNTFQSNNVSASSPIPIIIITRANDSDKEN